MLESRIFGPLLCSEGDCLGHIKSMMAANYHDRYYRVLVTGFVSEDMVTGFFFDIGSSAEIAIWDLLDEKTLLCIAANLRRNLRESGKKSAA